MTIETARQFFLWTTLLNAGMVLVWFALIAFARDWVRRLHGKWFRVSEDRFDAIHYAGIAFYKVGIFLFCLTPLLALLIIG